MGVVRDFKHPYTAAESWAYDFVVAPAVAVLAERMGARFVEGIPEAGRVLDVGCGGGQNALTLAGLRPDLRVVGLDLSEEQVSRATRRAAGFSQVEFIQGSALDLPFEDGEFDAVISVASLKHWPDQRQGLRECARVLRSGRRLRVVEADRGCGLDESEAFVAEWRLPALLRPLGVAMYRTWVAGRSVDLDEARELAGGLPLSELCVERVEGAPALMIEGIKI